ncbi:TPA: nucleoside deaminase [Candidatus Micrarchaeota archaeon]|nr:nucleoside deaminase [Candidatus Micrarchaeota archaeon]
MEPKEKFMWFAIDKAKKGIEDNQAPFGACIVKNSVPVGVAHNEVWGGNDITAHAEIVAIRKACQKFQTIDLSGCSIYCTCEPCPMCFSAIHWAKISNIIYGAGISDAKKCGFSELEIPNKVMKRMGKSSISIRPGFMKKECLDLFLIFEEEGGKERRY